MTERAINYLSVNADPTHLGPRALTALAIYKATDNLEHPVIASTLDKLASGAHISSEEGSVYAESVCLILLCETDPARFRPKIGAMAADLMKRQTPGGAWTYSTNQVGDTSQTQYAVLALWLSRKAGVNVPNEVFSKAMGWLIRTQDPEGGFGYLAKDTGSRQPQDGVSLSLSAAGMGSVYLCADALGMAKIKDEPTAEEADPMDPKVPPALRKVVEKKPGAEPKNTSAPAPAIANNSPFARSAAEGNRWFARNYRIDSLNWQYYYLYTLERFQSFKELAEGKSIPEPGWYNDGIRLLMTKQKPSGAICDEEGASATSSPSIHTSLAVLFMLRSTKKILDKMAKGEGTMQGGRRLPGNAITGVQVKDGKLVDTSAFKQVEDIASLIKEGADGFEMAGNVAANFKLSNVPETRKAQVARLTRMVSSSNYEVRRFSVKQLGRLGDLELAPTLLYALTDEDDVVFRLAHQGLQNTSRRFRAPTLPEEPASADFRKRVEAYWQDWYRTVRPDRSF